MPRPPNGCTTPFSCAIRQLRQGENGKPIRPSTLDPMDKLSRLRLSTIVPPLVRKPSRRQASISRWVMARPSGRLCAIRFCVAATLAAKG